MEAERVGMQQRSCVLTLKSAALQAVEKALRTASSQSWTVSLSA